MAIEITVKSDDLVRDVLEENPVQATRVLNIRKALDGNLLILDHPDIDIVVSPNKSKVVAFAKDEFGDHTYAATSRLFDYLSKKGIVEIGTVRGGNVYGSLEGNIPTNEQLDPIQAAIYVVDRFLQEEAPFYDRSDIYEDDLEKSLFEPDDKNSTELGEIPHEPRKGNVNVFPGATATYMHNGVWR
tara:strand:- start:854 stop:1411 length:558 start_codon:yes stop_codon:yes gene_type:complete